MSSLVIVCLVWTIIVLLNYIMKLKKAYFNLAEENRALRFKLRIRA